MPSRCDAVATDLRYGRTVQCTLNAPHPEPHFWSRVEHGLLLSASWYGDGVYIGPRKAPQDETEGK